MALQRQASLFSHTLARSLSGLSTKRGEPTENEVRRAEELMAQHRRENGNRRSGEYGYKDANPVLSKLAHGAIQDATPGLAQVLLEYGADVCIARPKSGNILKMMRGQDQVDLRSNVIEQATENCSTDVLFFLAQYADEQAVNQALPIAIRLADPLKLGILLAKGANAAPHCELFLQTVDSASLEIIGLLLGEVKGACQTCRNKALVRVVAAGNLEKAKLLMDSGADVSFNGSLALLEAIRKGSESMAIELVSRAGTKHPSLLDIAAECALEHGRPRVLEACLAAGMKPRVSNPMNEAECVPLRSGVVDNSPRDGLDAALLSAVKAGHIGTVRTFLSNGLPPDILASAINQIVDLPDVGMVLRTIEAFPSKGLRGDAVTNAICRVLTRPLLPPNETDRLQIIQLLLQKGPVDVNSGNGRALVLAIGQTRLDILCELLTHGPSVDTLALAVEAGMKLEEPKTRVAIIKLLAETGNMAKDEDLQAVAVVAASKHLALDILRFLAEFTTSPATFCAGFTALVRNTDIFASPEALDVGQFLLGRGVSGQVVDDALCNAAVRYDRDAFQLMATSARLEALEPVLSQVIQNSRDWQHPKNLWLLHSLLEWGCKGQAVNQALIDAVGAHVEGHTVDFVIDTLLVVGHGADVNHQHGMGMQIAARRGDTLLLNKLALSGAGRIALTNAFHATITSGLEERVALESLGILCAACKLNRTWFDVQAMLPDGRSPMLACLSTYPQSFQLVRHLLRLGCGVKARVRMKLDFDEEWVPMLMWAMFQRGIPVAPEILDDLVDADLDIISYRSSSGTTALMTAAKLGRKGLVVKLLQAHASTAEKDNFGRTALFLASRAGHLEVTNALITAGSRPNDGSLHEAAKHMHNEVVEALIKAKHEVNYPSSLHQGRSALQELCYCCRSNMMTPGLEETFRALERGKADLFVKSQGKSSLFLALENPQPYFVTKAFLDIMMWRDINHEKNVFSYQDPKTLTNFIYSPTMYLFHQFYRGDPANIPHLLCLLQEKGCDDRFFAEFGPFQTEELQPAEAVGVPQKIAAEDARRRADQEKRRIRDRDHMDKLRRDREEAQVKADIEREQHEMRSERQKQINMSRNAAAAQQAEARNTPRQARQSASAMNLKDAATFSNPGRKRLQK